MTEFNLSHNIMGQPHIGSLTILHSNVKTLLVTLGAELKLDNRFSRELNSE